MQLALDALDRLVDTLEERGSLSAVEAARSLFATSSISDGLACSLLRARVRERVVRAGGQLLYGTDIPGVVATLDVAELGLMQQSGMSPTQVLQSATGDAGEQLGMAPLGTLVPGAPADVLVVRGNPTRSLRALARPLLVMARGKRVR